MATHKNRNPIFNATLDGLDKIRIDAGTRRDGTGLARCEAAIIVVAEIIHAMNEQDLPQDTPRRIEVAALSRRVRETALFCAIHDQAARGELDDAAYGEALEACRRGVRQLGLG
jgi:hypothetical protein